MDKKQIEELRDTVDLMLSDDHTDRFKAEFLQLCIRMNKLSDFISAISIGVNKVDLPDHYINQLEFQLNKMGELFLEYDVRATLDNIDLSGQYQYRWAYYLVNKCYPEDPEGVTKDDIIAAVTDAPHHTRWIPCTERLPEKDVAVLTYHRNVSFDYQYVSWIDEYSGKWCGFIGNLSDDVLAWMPLPEDYTELDS